MGALGEPWIIYFDTGALADHLAVLGFTVTHDIGPSEIGEQWFGLTPDSSPRRGGHVVVATALGRASS